MTWLSQNAGTLVVLALLAAAIAAAVARLVRNKKKGGSTCGCGCDSCPMHGKCR